MSLRRGDGRSAVFALVSAIKTGWRRALVSPVVLSHGASPFDVCSMPDNAGRRGIDPMRKGARPALSMPATPSWYQRWRSGLPRRR
jgi:hypothetical protein